MQIIYKFIEKVPTAISPVFNNLIAVNDTFTNILEKLQGLISERQIRSMQLSRSVLGASSTAWQIVDSLTIPANNLKVGDSFEISSGGFVDKPFQSNQYLDFALGLNSTYDASARFTPTNALSTKQFFVNGHAIVTKVGTSGEIKFQLSVSCYTNSNTPQTINSIQSIFTINTTNSNNLHLSIRFSNSNAGNKVTTDFCNIIKE